MNSETVQCRWQLNVRVSIHGTTEVNLSHCHFIHHGSPHGLPLGSKLGLRGEKPTTNLPSRGMVRCNWITGNCVVLFIIQHINVLQCCRHLQSSLRDMAVLLTLISALGFKNANTRSDKWQRLRRKYAVASNLKLYFGSKAWNWFGSRTCSLRGQW